MTDEKLIEDVRLLAHWEPTKERRVEICEAAADRLQQYRSLDECDNCGQPRIAHCTAGGGTQSGECHWFIDKADAADRLIEWMSE